MAICTSLQVRLQPARPLPSYGQAAANGSGLCRADPAPRDWHRCRSCEDRGGCGISYIASRASAGQHGLCWCNAQLSAQSALTLQPMACRYSHAEASPPWMLQQNCCKLQHGRVGHHLPLQDEHCFASGRTSRAGAAGADGFVVGLPVTLNGTLTKRNTDSQQVRGRLLGCMQQASSDQPW